MHIIGKVAQVDPDVVGVVVRVADAAALAGEPQQVAVRRHVVEPVVVHADVRHVAGHVVDRHHRARIVATCVAIQGLVALGCSYEGANRKYLAINIPPPVKLEEIRSYLIEQDATWEHADPSYTQLFPANA